MDNDIKIRQATLEDLDLVTAIEAECFPAAEAATREQFAARLSAYADHFWIFFYQPESNLLLTRYFSGRTTSTPGGTGGRVTAVHCSEAAAI